MADEVQLNAGSGGDKIAADEIAGLKHQRVKIQHGGDGAATDVSTASPLPTRLTLPGTPFIRYLDIVGDGTGTKQAAVDYSGGAEEFFIAPPSGDDFVIQQFAMVIADTGSFDGDFFAATAGLLSIGLAIAVTDAVPVVQINLLDGIPIKRNSEIFNIFSRVVLNDLGSGRKILHAVIDFDSMGFPLELDGGINDRLMVTLNDDFSLLDDFYFVARGYEKD